MEMYKNHLLLKPFVFDSSFCTYMYVQGSLFLVLFTFFIFLVSFYLLGPFNISNRLIVFFLEYRNYIFPLYLLILFVCHILFSFTFFNLSIFLYDLYDNITDNGIYKEFVHIDMYKDSDNESDSNASNIPEEDDIKDFSDSSSNNNDNQDDSNKNEDNKKRKIDEMDDDEMVEESSNKKHKFNEPELPISDNTEDKDNINLLESDDQSNSTNLPESSNESNTQNLAEVVSENQAEGNTRVRIMPDTSYGAHPHTPEDSIDSDASENSGEDDCGCDHRQNNSSSCTHNRVQALSEAGGLQCCYCHGESPNGCCNSMGSHCCCVFHLSCVPRD